MHADRHRSRRPDWRTVAAVIAGTAIIGAAFVISPHLHGQQDPRTVAASSRLGTPPHWVRCTNTARGVWNMNRTFACLVQSETDTVYRIRDGVPPEVVGTIDLTTYQQFSLSPGNTSWTESFAVSADKVENLPDTFTVNATQTCSSPCQRLEDNAFGGAKQITVGQTLDGMFWDQDDPAVGTADSLQIGYQLDVSVNDPNPDHAGEVLTSSVTWSGPSDPLRPNVQIRCDRIITTRNYCVVWPFVPQFDITQQSSRWGASAAMINWAQYNLATPWGTQRNALGRPIPLTRLRNPAMPDQNDDNRDAICDRTFVRRGNGDSCDEFPFAATYESGGMRGFRGTDCYEITVQQVNGIYRITVDHPGNPAASCVRAHVPGDQNSRIGTDLESFLNDNHVLDHDPYYVQLVYTVSM